MLAAWTVRCSLASTVQYVIARTATTGVIRAIVLEDSPCLLDCLVHAHKPTPAVSKCGKQRGWRLCVWPAKLEAGGGRQGN